MKINGHMTDLHGSNVSPAILHFLHRSLFSEVENNYICQIAPVKWIYLMWMHNVYSPLLRLSSAQQWLRGFDNKRLSSRAISSGKRLHQCYRRVCKWALHSSPSVDGGINSEAMQQTSLQNGLWIFCMLHHVACKLSNIFLQFVAF